MALAQAWPADSGRTQLESVQAEGRTPAGGAFRVFDDRGGPAQVDGEGRRQSSEAQADDDDDERADTPIYVEFSRYLRETTGRTLADAVPFKRSATRSPKLPDSYQLGTGDEIEIQVWGSVSAKYKLQLDSAGRVFVPDVGSVVLDGVRLRDLTSTLYRHFTHLYKNIELRAVLARSRGITVSIAGQAQAVGLKTVSAAHTLLSATVGHARPAPGGSRRFVQFQRRGEQKVTIDLYCFFRGSCDAMPDVLRDGDTITVPARAMLVAVGGAVSRPGIFELSATETVAELLAYAGHAAITADATIVYYYSFAGPGATPRSLRVVPLSSLCSSATASRAAADAPCIRLADGDYIELQPIRTVVRNMVTVVVPGVEPVKLEYRSGMRLADAIGPPFDRFIPRGASQTANAGSFTALSDLDKRLPPLDLDAMTLYRFDPERREYVSRRVSYASARAALADAELNVALADGDVLVIDHESTWKTRRDRLRMSVQVMGEVGSPGRYQFVGGRSLGEVLTLAGGVLPEAAPWGALILRRSDGRTSINRAIMDQALRSISVYERTRAAVNSDKAVIAAPEVLSAERRVAEGEGLSERTRAEAQALMKGREVVYPFGNGGALSMAVRLEPDDIILIPPQRDTYACQGAFFKSGEFVVGTSAIKLADAVSRCGEIEEMKPTLYHFVARENRVCRKGWFNSCPDVTSGDVIVAVPEVIARSGVAAVLDWVDVTLKTLTTLATVKVLSR